jgi:transcriptional regulator with XRE-family HTH domain
MYKKIGEKIKEVLNSQGMTKVELSKRIKRKPQTVDDILIRSSIDSELLFVISKALNYNFFEWLSNEYKLPPNEPITASSNEWQQKYFEIMEENRQLSKEVIKLHKELKNLDMEMVELKGRLG